MYYLNSNNLADILENIDFLIKINNYILEWKDIYNLKETCEKIYQYYNLGNVEIYCEDTIKEYSDEKDIIYLFKLFPKLRTLNLGGNCLANRNIYENELIKSFKNLYSLEFLYNNKILLNFNHNLPNLISLSVSGDNSICDKIIEHMSNLVYLSLPSNNKISDTSMCKLKKLRYLNLENNTQLTDNSIEKLVNLEHLILDRNENITNYSIHNLKNLKILSIFWNRNITFKAFAKYFRGDKSIDLKYLKIRENIFKDDNISYDIHSYSLTENINYFQNIMYIKVLKISNAQEICDNDIEQLKYLEELSLEKNTKLSDNSILLLNNLKKLSLFENNLITDIGITYHGKIERVFMEQNSLITRNVLNSYWLPYLQVIRVKHFQYSNFS
jgi:hypothetical protein